MRATRYIIILLCLLVAACTREPVSSYCNDHRAAHAQHQMEIAKLAVSYTGEGLVEVKVSLPVNKLNDDIDALTEISNVISMRGEKACDLISSEVNQEGAKATAHYSLDCGPDENSLKQVDVKLLDTFPAIEEVEADITMPAVRKYFAINRQCEKPIFKS